MSTPTIGIVVTAHNGAAHLGAQLASLDAQDAAPDVVLIADDASKDGTTALARAFVAGRGSAALLLETERNLGLTRNLNRALAACAADVLLLCDQDDVWHPGKVRAFRAGLAAEPRAFAAFSDARLCDAALRPLGPTLWQVERCGAREQACAREGRLIRLLAERNVVQGASLGFRAELLPWILPIPEDLHMRLWCHDGWIAAIASAFGPVVPLPLPLIDYRVHGGNQVARYTRTNALRRFLPGPVRTLARSLMQARAERTTTNAVRERDLRQQVRHLERLLERLTARVDSPLVPDPVYTRLIEQLLESRRRRLALPTGLLARLGEVRRLRDDGVYRDDLAGSTLLVRDVVGA